MHTADRIQKSTLLTAGMLVAPVFYITALSQIAFRPEFDIRKVPLSYLSLGALGWIQDVNFLLTGGLAVLCALGLRKAIGAQRAGLFTTVLVAVFGLGMMAAGVFAPDPMPVSGSALPKVTPTGIAHMVAFMAAFLSLILAAFLTAWRFASERRISWAAYSFATGLIAPVLVIVGARTPAWVGVIIAGAGLVLFSWVGMISLQHKRAAREGMHEHSSSVVAQAMRLS